MCVECAFGRLKGHWCCLLKRTDFHISIINTIIAACCVLHNMCETHNERSEGELLPEMEQQPEECGEIPEPGVGGQEIRTALADYFSLL